MEVEECNCAHPSLRVAPTRIESFLRSPLKEQSHFIASSNGYVRTFLAIPYSYSLFPVLWLILCASVKQIRNP